MFLASLAVAAGLGLASCGGQKTNNAAEEPALTLSGLNPADFQTDSTQL